MLQYWRNPFFSLDPNYLGINVSLYFIVVSHIQWEHLPDYIYQSSFLHPGMVQWYPRQEWEEQGRLGRQPKQRKRPREYCLVRYFVNDIFLEDGWNFILTLYKQYTSVYSQVLEITYTTPEKIHGWNLVFDAFSLLCLLLMIFSLESCSFPPWRPGWNWCCLLKLPPFLFYSRILHAASSLLGWLCITFGFTIRKFSNWFICSPFRSVIFCRWYESLYPTSTTALLLLLLANIICGAFLTVTLFFKGVAKIEPHIYSKKSGKLVSGGNNALELCHSVMYF